MSQTNKMFFSSESKMSDVVLFNPHLYLLLDHFDILLPLQEKSVSAICAEKNINPTLFLTFTNLYNGINESPTASLTHKDIIPIIDFLKNSHKYFLQEIYPNILASIQKLSEVNKHQEVALVKKFFVDYFNEVTEHLEYENNEVFPYVLSLHQEFTKKKDSRLPSYSVKEYKDNHDDIEEKLNDLKNLLIKYLPNENDALIRRNLLFQLHELEYDLTIHSNIEGMILIPLVDQMETYLKDDK